MRSVKSLLNSSANWRQPSVCLRATGRARDQERHQPERPARPQRRSLQRAHAGALGPQRQLLAAAPRPPSGIRCLPWQPARRNRKSLPHAAALARTMSAPRLPGSNGLAALKSATGSSTPHRRARRSNAPRSDAGTKRSLAPLLKAPPWQARANARANSIRLLRNPATPDPLWPSASFGRFLLWSLEERPKWEWL